MYEVKKGNSIVEFVRKRMKGAKMAIFGGKMTGKKITVIDHKCSFLKIL